MWPLLASILIAAMTPLYSLAYLSMLETVPFGTGTEKREAMMAYSVFGVTNDEAWLPETFGIGPKICFVLKSRRSTRAMRPFISLTKSQRPSYSPAVSESAGWWTSPHVKEPSIAFDSSSKPYPVAG